FRFSWSIPIRSCNRARCACSSTSASTSSVKSRLADPLAPRGGAASIPQRFVQDAREPKAVDCKLVIHDRQALVVIVLLEVMTGRQRIGNIDGRLVGFIRPVSRLAALQGRDVLAREPALVETPDVFAPVKDVFSDDALVPQHVQRG